MNYALENGILDLSHIQERVAMSKRKEILEKHPYSIWEGKDGKWYTYLPDDIKGRKLKKRNSQSEIEDIVIGYWREAVVDPTIKDVFYETYDRKLELNKISAATYTRNEQVFNRHFEKFGEHKIRKTCAEDFVEFLEEQIPKFNLTAKGFANLKGIVNGIIKYARRKHWVDYTMDDVLAELDVSDREFRKSIKMDSEEVFNEEETEKVMKYLIANPDVWNLGLLLLFVTGLRVGELTALHWEDVSSEAIFVRRTETRFRNEDGKWEYRIKDFPKTEASVRIVAIPQSYQWIMGAIRKLHDDEQFVLVHNGKRLNTNCMRHRFRLVCKNAKVACKSPHKIRKTYCSILFENNVDSKMITDQMGHTDIMCSEMFYHRNRKNFDEKVETISAIPDFKPRMTLIV